MKPTSSRLGQARARHSLRAANLPFQVDLERASSTRNEIYLSPEHVIRMNMKASQRLRREALLYEHLPDCHWSPRLLGAGGELGADFLIVERKPGQPLAHTWPDLPAEKRRRAIEQLADAMEAIHTTLTPEDLPSLSSTPQLLGGYAESPVEPVLSGLDQLAHDPNLDSGVIDLATGYVAEHAWLLEDLPDKRLIHGDLTFENVLWDGANVSAIVDFEWSRGAPADLDLDVLLRCCSLPAEHVAPDYESRTKVEDYANVPTWLAESYPALFSHPRLRERLMLYAISFEVAELLQIDTAECRGHHHAANPYTRLIALVSTGGHVNDALDRAGLAV